MEKWLECTITLGQFSGEYAVQGEMFDATDFSLFAPKKDLIFHEEPATGKPVKGLIRIVPGAQKEDLLLGIMYLMLNTARKYRLLCKHEYVAPKS